MIRIVIAEDHNALIDGIRIYLKQQEAIQLVGYANNGHDLCNLVKVKKPDVVVTDIRMPVMDGIAATRCIRKENPHIKIIAFTMFSQDEAVQQMIQAGASGYLLKNSNLEELITAIQTVATGDTYFDAGIVIPELKTTARTKNILSRRQVEILQLIAQGKTNQEIADLLFIGKTTVETHRKNMIRILNLKGAGELLRYALESKYNF
jgi:two-component system, NarL family, response regulator NreC